MNGWIEKKYISLVSGRLPLFRWNGDSSAIFRCVFCGDSDKHKRKCRGYLYKRKTRWFYYCHNCHRSMATGTLLKEFAPDLHQEFLLECLREHRSGGPRATPAIMTHTETMRFGKIEPVIYQHAEKISDLPEAHYCRQYVKNRQIPKLHWSKLYYAEHYNLFLDEIAPQHGKTIKDEPRLCIMFYDPFGAVCAVSGRALGVSDLRYITVRTTEDANKLVYGLERVNQDKLVLIVEGPLDSLFLDNAVASGDANLLLTANRLSAQQVVLVYDNEARSPAIIEQMERAIKAGHKVVVWPTSMTEKDINNMVLAGFDPSAIQHIIYTHTYSGLTALTHLSQWKKCTTSNNRRIITL